MFGNRLPVARDFPFGVAIEKVCKFSDETTIAKLRTHLRIRAESGFGVLGLSRRTGRLASFASAE